MKLTREGGSSAEVGEGQHEGLKESKRTERAKLKEERRDPEQISSVVEERNKGETLRHTAFNIAGTNKYTEGDQQERNCSRKPRTNFKQHTKPKVKAARARR